MSAKKTMGERYLLARRTSNLKIAAESGGASDVLMAAGWVSGASERKTLALAVYGVMSSTEMQGARALADQMSGWIVRRSYRQAGQVIPRTTAFDLALTVLKWFHRPTCLACGGHGHPTLLNSPVIDTTRACPECHGTGEIPLRRIVRTDHVEHARWLVAELQSMTALVFGEMAKRMGSDHV